MEETLEGKGLMPHTGGILGGGYPSSRDWQDDIPCKRGTCVCNNESGMCVVPSRATIGEDGRCEGYQPKGTLKTKDESSA